MSIETAFGVASAVLISIGGGGGIVFAFSNWLGKFWASRLMLVETARHNQELEQLRTRLQTQADQRSQTYKQKIELYKEVSTPLIDLVVKAQHAGTLTPKDLQEFDQSRLSTTALLAMFAPLSVFHEYNDLIDYIYNAFDGKEVWSFLEFRPKALKFLSMVRADIGLYQDEVCYLGNR